MSEVEYQTHPQKEALARRALRAAAIMAGNSLIFLGMILYLTFQTPAWQLYILLVVTFITAPFGFISVWQIRRGRVALGIGILFGYAIPPMTASLMISSTGPPAAAFIIVFSSLLIIWTLPVKSRRWPIVYSLITVAVALTIEWLNPAFRLNVPELVSFAPIATGIMAALFFVTIMHQIWGGPSLQAKFLLGVGTGVFLVAAFIIGMAASSLRNEAINRAQNNVDAIAQSHATQIKEEIELGLDTGRTLAQSLKAVTRTENPITLTRDQVNAMLRQVLEDNPRFLGTYTLWEPNAFDGLDEQYINAEAHDETGRFIPYWFRGDDGEIILEALLEYETEGIGDWYLLPKQTGQEQALDPFLYPIQGADVLLTSLVTPIVVDGQFYGIAGVDFRIDSLQQLAEEAFIYDGDGRVVLISNNGTLVGATGQADLIGQPITTLSDDYADDLDNIKRGETFTRQYGDDLSVFVPIIFGNTETPWSVNILIPNEKITADATASMWRMINIGIFLTLVVLILLWFIIRRLIRPILEITGAALQVAGGNLDTRAEAESNDELGVLASTFNDMTAQLQATLGTLEQKVADRTRALKTSAEVSRRLSTILEQDQLVTEVVEQLQSAFDYYHAHIYLFGEGGANLIMVSGTGEAGQTMLAQGHKIAKGQGLVGRASETNMAVLVPDVSQEDGWLPNPLLPDTKSEIAVPIAIGSKVLGVLDVQHNLVHGLDQSDAELLTAIANQVAVALENARLYERSQEQAERQVAINLIGQRILETTTIEEAMQTAVRELGRAINAPSTTVCLSAESMIRKEPDRA
ncbi:MAG: GAF domain-containing protein [Chloroflexi bacterium]|nr:GAF domain-containing protein [Chloroflexota bacterium]